MTARLVRLFDALVFASVPPGGKSRVSMADAVSARGNHTLKPDDACHSLPSQKRDNCTPTAIGLTAGWPVVVLSTTDRAIQTHADYREVQGMGLTSDLLTS